MLSSLLLFQPIILNSSTFPNTNLIVICKIDHSSSSIQLISNSVRNVEGRPVIEFICYQNHGSYCHMVTLKAACFGKSGVGFEIG